ncbi:MAG: AbfB domain-containing protein [Myxococcales bacterium]|nr:AbfB domain-containing protein [Myxococcales bacterium]MCB9749159.1 AbfB domain-containing protein [Myxococcales bacterium]
MKTSTTILTVLAALTVNLFAAGAAQANECALPIVGETHLLRSHDTGDYVQNNGGVAVTDAISNLADAQLEIVPGLLDPSKVSLRLASDPTRYLAVTSGSSLEVGLFTDDGTAAFDLRATFEIMPGMTTGDCNYTGVSLRWHYAHQLGQEYYLTLGGSGDGSRPLYVYPQAPNQAAKPSEQTFAIDFQEHTGPICAP